MSEATALLLVDCQEDYFARGGLLPERATLISAIAEALAAARAKGWPVFHVRTDGTAPMPHRRSAPEAVIGTTGGKAPDALRERPGEPVFTKRFFSAFDAPGLKEALHERGIKHLLIAGVHSHACIQASVLDAYAHGFEVTVGQDLVGSYDPAHAQQALSWLDGRAASVRPSAAVFGTAPKPWQHRNPCNWDEVLGEVEVLAAAAVADQAQKLRELQPLPIAQRAERLAGWHQQLSENREIWIESLVRDLGKPRADAEGEIGYGLGLLSHVAQTLAEEETGAGRRVRYRPHGVAGLVTPWNNPFAIPIAKLAPALGYGNAALWKPALPASRIAAMLHASLADCGLGELVALATGDSITGQAVLALSDCISFTGSAAVGRQIAAVAGRRFIPVQAELGGSNAAIIDATADLDMAAADLAAAMFSFAGQRCTAIRRLVVVDEVFDAFVERLVAKVEALRVGDPSDPATQVGPVIDKGRQQDFLALARNGGGQLLAGRGTPFGVPAAGCWVAPTLLADVPAGHPLLTSEVFGPLAAIVRVPDLAAAISAHNASDLGLLGALFSKDEASQVRFLAEAQAGILSLNRARPPFAAEGPFTGWKGSGYGTPEHGRWNRDFYTRVQAVYGD